MHMITNKTEFEEICSKNKYVLVDFYAEWCGPCKYLKPLLEKLNESYKHVKFVKVDVDMEENQELVDLHNISAMPTIMFYVNGKLQKDFVKGADINNIKTYCDKYFNQNIFCTFSN